MSEKNKKQKKGFNSDEKTTFGVGVFLGLLGLLSICIALVRINEIKNVELVVPWVNLKRRIRN